MPNKYVIVRGSVEIPKHALHASEYAQLISTLTIHNQASYADEDAAVRAYKETADKIYVPKFYFTRVLAKRLLPFTISHEAQTGKKHNWPFEGALRPHQLTPRAGCTPTADLADLILRHRGVFAEAQCGSGKTVSAIYTIHKLGMRTLVVVPNLELVKQWKAQLSRFLPSVKVTEYTGRKKDLTGDVVVASLQLLSATEPGKINFPFVIVDEVHMTSTTCYSRIIFAVNFRYSLALTATGNRLDGMDALFRWSLANKTIKLDTDQMPVLVIYRPFRHADYVVRRLNRVDKFAVDQALVMEDRRSAAIVLWLINAFQNGRRILVLSKSILQLRILRDAFVKHVPEARTAMFTNEVTFRGKKVEKLKRTADQVKEDLKYLRDPDAVVFATIGKAGVGYDDPNKDCLILALPMMDPRQVIGRVQRALPGKKPPLVLIPVDNLTGVIGRMRSAYERTLRPLGKYCRLVNECSWYSTLSGEGVVHKLTAGA